MRALRKLADDAVNYGRAKEAFRLLRERPSSVVPPIVVSLLDDRNQFVTDMREAVELVRSGEVEYVGALLKLEPSNQEYQPLMLYFKVEAKEGVNEPLYHAKQPIIQLWTHRIKDAETDEFLEAIRKAGKTLLYEGTHKDFDQLKVYNVKQVIEGR